MPTGNFPLRNYPRGDPDEPDELNEHVHDPGDPDGVVAAEARKRWRETHPAPERTPHAAYRPKPVWPKIVAVAVILVAAAFGSYWLGSHQAHQKQQGGTAGNASRQNNQAQHSSQPAQPVATPTKHYDSATYTLGFDYPQTWTVSDTAAKLTITSPPTQLATAGGSKTSVQVVVTMQNPQAAIPGYPAGGAVAALASDHLTYKQPSTVQRAQTYLSYLSYTAPNGLDALYITGDNGYQQGQQIPMSDVIKGNPLIGVAFNACADENCTAPKPVTLDASAWQSSASAKDVTNLLESIVLQ